MPSVKTTSRPNSIAKLTKMAAFVVKSMQHTSRTRATTVDSFDQCLKTPSAAASVGDDLISAVSKMIFLLHPVGSNASARFA